MSADGYERLGQTIGATISGTMPGAVNDALAPTLENVGTIIQANTAASVAEKQLKNEGKPPSEQVKLTMWEILGLIAGGAAGAFGTSRVTRKVTSASQRRMEVAVAKVVKDPPAT
uniref:Uncharacterized protein n=1 Tax=viral metagenome TaxID=1070528 RepID=A0A2V0RMC0_9ZZZZ